MCIRDRFCSVLFLFVSFAKCTLRWLGRSTDRPTSQPSDLEIPTCSVFRALGNSASVHHGVVSRRGKKIHKQNKQDSRLYICFYSQQTGAWFVLFCLQADLFLLTINQHRETTSTRNKIYCTMAAPRETKKRTTRRKKDPNAPKLSLIHI